MNEPFKPPWVLTLALAALRVHMIVSVLLLGFAVLADPVTVTSTNNYYSAALGIPRELFPAICFVSSAVSMIALLLVKRQIIRAMVMVLAALPFLIYCLAATYFVYFVATPARTLVTGVVYWSAIVGYFVGVAVYLGIGAWIEELRIVERRRT